MDCLDPDLGRNASLQFLVLQMALKCADLGHLAQPAELHRVWVNNLQEEFFLQGDQERQAGLPVSALMDREKHAKLSSSQASL